MTGIRVVTDSACDLPDELIEEYHIELVPLSIRFGETELTDRVELSTKEFWVRCAGSGPLPETAAPSPGAFHRSFSKLADEGAGGIVCIDLSSGLSATIEAARQAARDVPGNLEVRVIDSRSVTMGLGLLVLAAADAARAGQDLDQVTAAVEQLIPKVRVFGAIDTLENLKRGGRIGNARALLGSLLSIKPVIEVRDGVVEEESKQRTRGRSLRYLADKVLAAGPLDRLAVFGGDADDFDDFASLLAGVTPSHPTLRSDIGPVIGTHAGPGAVGVAWIPAS